MDNNNLEKQENSLSETEVFGQSENNAEKVKTDVEQAENAEGQTETYSEQLEASEEQTVSEPEASETDAEQAEDSFEKPEAVSEQPPEAEVPLPEGVCEKCGAFLAEGQIFCGKCGFSRKQGREKVCSKCGGVLYEGQEFCPKCGHKAAADAGIGEVKKKKTIPTAAAIAVIVIIAAAIILKKPSVEEISLSSTEVTVKAGESQLVTYEILPEKAADTKVVWESSDETVATVNESGYITAVSEGSCTITATAGKQTDSLEVKVKGKPNFLAIYWVLGSPSYASAGSDGSYLKIDTNPNDTKKYSNEDAVKDILTVNALLGLPESLTSEMGSTTALMGRQSETFADADVNVSWSYHPDNGLEVTYSLIN